MGLDGIGVARGVAARVGGVRGVDGEAKAALQLLVRADLAERAPIGEGAAQRQVELSHRHPKDSLTDLAVA
jgi:hypothetical protein